ncbi:MAG: tetratricopeptide repeat protein, partial [Magnetospirillum sp.]|nr:tetratricopeptide repeat protein [Magnetospirillum sp.]
MGGKTIRLAGCVALATLTAACQTTREQENTAIKPEVVHSYLAGKPKSLEKHFYVSLVQGQRNQVLNDMRLGLAALELGDDKLAESLLDDALGRIESIYVDNPDAAKARELFTKELVKDFKGEPYERAMAYYYRGLLYLKAGDYDNARASFKGGFIQDSFADEDQHQADFGLLQYLQGWASRCRGNNTTAADDFAEFKKIKPGFPLPADGDNTLLLVETGQPPVKFSAAA